ncbi:GYDIA family GHMP kinase [Flavobacterium channae]|uniref:GYDIA family GHMP kinase n=1 Tax=Flavobacterium channae TaxID=2897181 RepID=UPI001E3B4DA6|nr:GYDIA family GHMP kinase [Flavobacterium channae]UGS23956.1 GHMP kinase [Flavobacterium channae]
MEIQTFYSNGKLLITGEYVVLDGAKALALPTKFGQKLVVKEGDNKIIKWTSYDSDGSVWFNDYILFEEVRNKTVRDTNSSVKNTLIEILHQAFIQNPTFLDKNGFEIETFLTFPRLWGLGTSSTLINSIGDWLQIDAFELLQKSFGGSGYDIACAKADSPIIYQLENEQPHYKPIHFNPSFKENIHFVYLNQKQSSKLAIANYMSKHHHVNAIISKINTISYEAIDCKEGKEFAKLMEKHEIIMSDVLELQTVKEKLFPDFKGVIKSLGAWGGDFVMAVSKENPKDYFIEKGYNIVLSYEEMIL